jgi:short-subunit dehydrogenase
MRGRGQGHIAIVASLAGLTPLAGALGYSASKSALVAYGLGLNQALHKEGVGVSVICPGFVETPITERHLGWQPFRLTAAGAAEKIARGIAAKKALVAFPLPLHLIARPSILVPEFVRRFVGNFFSCRAASPAVVPPAPAQPLRMAGE